MAKSGISLLERQSMATALVADLTNTTLGSSIALFQNNIIPDPTTPLAGFTECDFVGYARKTAVTTWVTFNDAPTGDQIVQNSVLELFAAGAIVSPQTAYGWYVTNPGYTTLLGWGVFDTPYTFLANGDKKEVNVNFRILLNTAQWSG